MQAASIEEIVRFFHREDDEIILGLQAANLLPRRPRCNNRNCRRPLTLQRRASEQLGHTFKCSRCATRRSILRGTFFEAMHVPVKKCVTLMWLWAAQTQAAAAAAIMNMRKQTVLQQFRFFRDICSWKLVQTPELFLLGGPGHVVQIDESVVTRRKFNVGRRVPPRWVVGMYDTTLGRGCIVYVTNRSATTLTDLIVEHVAPGSTIWTDCWRGYANLATLGGVSQYTHHTVNHSRNFVDPQTGTCTNHVEGYWSRLKRFCRTQGVMHSALLPEHIDQFMWMEHFGPRGSQAFTNLQMQIADRYPPA